MLTLTQGFPDSHNKKQKRMTEGQQEMSGARKKMNTWLGVYLLHLYNHARRKSASQAYCIVAVESAGKQIPMAFLERVKDDFCKRYGEVLLLQKVLRESDCRSMEDEDGILSAAELVRQSMLVTELLKKVINLKELRRLAAQSLTDAAGIRYLA